MARGGWLSTASPGGPPISHRYPLGFAQLTGFGGLVRSVSAALAIVEDEVRELVRRRSLDPVLEPEATRRLVDDVVADYQDRALVSKLPHLGDPAAAARMVFDQVAGFGALQQFLDDPLVEEIWINEPS